MSRCIRVPQLYSLLRTMRRHVDHENKMVYFEGDWPSVMGIPHIMKRDYPGYDKMVLGYHDFKERFGKANS